MERMAVVGLHIGRGEGRSWGGGNKGEGGWMRWVCVAMSVVGGGMRG